MAKLNRLIIVKEESFSLDMSYHMINNSEVFKELEKINIKQKVKDITQKVEKIMIVFQNQT